MFNYKKSGKGVINGNYVVFFTNMIGEDINMSFHDKKYEAITRAKYLNDILKCFIEIIKKS